MGGGEDDATTAGTTVETAIQQYLDNVKAGSSPKGSQSALATRRT